MTQEERTQLIREIKELLQLDYQSRIASRGSMFDDETIKIMKAVLQKLFAMSLV
jgi:hypothetical protein